MASNATVAEKPDWLRVRYHSSASVAKVREILSKERVRTVCDSSQCPNLGECWGERNATLLIMGDVCTRNCRFCAVTHGQPMPVDENEGERVGRAVAALGLRYVVITSVTRDDLRDGGASIFVDSVRAIRRASPRTFIELLIPDLAGDWDSLERVVKAGPEVIGHNVEVVRSLQGSARDPRATYGRSLQLLDRVKDIDREMITKSSLMVGLGETREEIIDCMRDLRRSRVDLLTLGQYLRPKGIALPVSRYVAPEEFDELKANAESLGFAHVESGPLVRSSYHAEASFNSIGRG